MGPNAYLYDGIRAEVTCNQITSRPRYHEHNEMLACGLSKLRHFKRCVLLASSCRSVTVVSEPSSDVFGPGYIEIIEGTDRGATRNQELNLVGRAPNPYHISRRCSFRSETFAADPRENDK